MILDQCSLTYSFRRVHLWRIIVVWAFCQSQFATVTKTKLFIKIFIGWNLIPTSSPSWDLRCSGPPTWREWCVKQNRCCRCWRSALDCLTYWAPFNAGTVKWVHDSSVLAAQLGAALGWLRQQDLLKHLSMTASGIPLFMDNGTWVIPGLQSYRSQQRGSTKELKWAVDQSFSQTECRCCHGLHKMNVLQYIYVCLTFTDKIFLLSPKLVIL